MAQKTDLELIIEADVIGNETVALANTKTRVANAFKNNSDSKINNDKIDTDNALVTALKTVAGRDAVKAYIDNLITTEVTARNLAISTAITNLINGAPGALDTLEELATALADDQNFATTVVNSLALKANLTDLLTLEATAKTNDFTFSLADVGPVTQFNKATPIIGTIPLNDTVAFQIGTNIELSSIGAGEATVAITATGTLTSSSGNFIIPLNNIALLRKTGTDTWKLYNGAPPLTWSTLTPTQTGIASALFHNIKYIIEGKRCTMLVTIAGTGNTLDPITITNLPAVSASNRILIIFVNNNTTMQVGKASIATGTTTMTITATPPGAAFTDNTYREADFEITYDIQ